MRHIVRISTVLLVSAALALSAQAQTIAGAVGRVLCTGSPRWSGSTARRLYQMPGIYGNVHPQIAASLMKDTPRPVGGMNSAAFGRSMDPKVRAAQKGQAVANDKQRLVAEGDINLARGDVRALEGGIATLTRRPLTNTAQHRELRDLRARLVVANTNLGTATAKLSSRMAELDADWK